MMRLFNALSLSALLASAKALDDRGCVDSAVPSGTDLFPNKVEPKHSEYWDVQYFGMYKIVTNKSFNLTYLLYQCGTEIPADKNDGSHAAVLEIPLTDVAITVTPMISFMEQLGLRDQIATFLTDKTFVSSPCFAEAIENGEINSLNRADDGSPPSLEGLNLPDQSKMTTFIGGYEQSTPTARPPFANTFVAVSENFEKTNNAMFEWVKFFSIFFNKEDVANEVFDAAEARFACVSSNAAVSATDSGNKPKLLWAYYSGFCGGWDVGECPNYYCEFAVACSAEFMGSSEGTNEAAMNKCGATYMTDDEFFAHAKDADYWFFPSPNWNATETMYANRLNEIKAYREKKVYDYMGRGENAWFEQRFAEYYKIVEDICHTLGVKESLMGRHFWRDVLTEPVPPDGKDAVCDESEAANILADPDKCVPLFPKENPQIPADDSAAPTAGQALVGAILTAAAFFNL